MDKAVEKIAEDLGKLMAYNLGNEKGRYKLAEKLYELGYRLPPDRPELEKEIKAISHSALVAKVATRWKVGYSDEEMEEWLTLAAKQILALLPNIKEEDLPLLSDEKIYLAVRGKPANEESKLIAKAQRHLIAKYLKGEEW